MSLHFELPVYKATYDLLIEIFIFTKEFKREFKYTIGENLKNETISLLILIFRANSRKDKRAVLQEARESIELIRLLVRVVKDLKEINLSKFIKINEKIENVSKQLSAWQKKFS